MLPAVAANNVEVAFAGTITEEAGTGSRLLLLASPTTVPPFGAAWFSVTVHVVAAPEFRLVGLQDSEDKVTDSTDATKLTVADLETPLGTIAEASFEYPLSAPVLSTVVVT
jgi:hypothetical protein